MKNRCIYYIRDELLRDVKTAFSRLPTGHDFSKHLQLGITDRQARIKGYESEYKSVPKLREHDHKIKKEFS
ncbi:MAG TPA: hypothetical protein VJ915_11615 [Balneolaceae bacterium]|nr:hypothetical protein [Balneolaceae bacterium]